MTNFKVRGKISSISDKKTLDNGSVVLDYVVDSTSDNGYVTQYNFGMYKKPDYAEHVDNFLQFNSVGDVVEVEFTIRSQVYKEKVYNNLNHWRCDKVDNGTLPDNLMVEDDSDDLPF